MANTGNKNFEVINQVVAWRLKCFEVKESEKGVTLKCALNGKKGADGKYPKPLYVNVWCSFESCDIKEDDYTNATVLVDGQFAVGEWKKDDGTAMPQYTIFADKVVKYEWKN